MSNQPMNRRIFLESTAAGAAATAAAAAWGLGARPAWADEPTGKPTAGKIGEFKISLAEWSLNRAIRSKEIDNLDFPKIAREQYSIEGVEFVNQFFQDKAQDSAYLKELKSRAGDVGVTCVLIMIDHEGDLSDPDASGATRRSTTTRSGSMRPPRWAATRSASIREVTTARPMSAPWPRHAPS